MSSNGEIYIMQDTDEEWVSPTPASEAIVDAVTSQTELEAGSLDDIDEYVDAESLRGLLEGDDDEPVTLNIEGHDVTIYEDGSIDVEE